MSESRKKHPIEEALERYQRTQQLNDLGELVVMMVHELGVPRPREDDDEERTGLPQVQPREGQ